jgi:hypothetical protein
MKTVRFKNGLSAELQEFGDDKTDTISKRQLAAIGSCILPEDLVGRGCLKFAFGKSMVKLVFPFKTEDTKKLLESALGEEISVSLKNALFVLFDRQVYSPFVGRGWHIMKALHDGIDPRISALLDPDSDAASFQGFLARKLSWLRKPSLKRP